MCVNVYITNEQRKTDQSDKCFKNDPSFQGIGIFLNILLKYDTGLTLQAATLTPL